MEEIFIARDVEQILSCYPVMQQLRPHLTSSDAFIERMQRQQESGYQLVYCQEGGIVRALAGYRFLEFMAWGKVLYIDDLVTDAQTRRAGHAGKLLQWLFAEAEKKGCDEVHLDSGSHRHDAHRLYLKSGMKIIGYHFSKEI